MPWRGWGCGLVSVSCGCADFQLMPAAGDCFCLPAGVFFGVVAGFAEPGPVGQARGAAVVPGNDVVDMAYGRIAVTRAAGVVPGLDEAPHPAWEESGFGVHGQQFTGG